MEFKFRNVNESFRKLVSWIHWGDIETVKVSTRAGEVLQVSEPVLIQYSHPTERVLFNQGRDANPFFHLYEALWMLAGRRDVESLAYFNSKIGKIASDDGVMFNGAYGHRWRFHYTKDSVVNQLSLIVDHLTRLPNSRRAVLQMWNVKDDLLLVENSKDVCCNTNIYFAISNGRLDMTVCNRSNDLVWGMLGANYVHFTILQEFLAAYLEVEVGVYNHFTNNLHVYLDNWDPDKWLSTSSTLLYPDGLVAIDSPAVLEDELSSVLDCQDVQQNGLKVFESVFLDTVAYPMFQAFHYHKKRNYGEARNWVEEINSLDWKIACKNWIRIREENYANKMAGKLQ